MFLVKNPQNTSKKPKIDIGISQDCGGLQSSYFEHSLGTQRAYFAPHLRSKLLFYDKGAATFLFLGQNPQKGSKILNFGHFIVCPFIDPGPSLPIF